MSPLDARIAQLTAELRREADVESDWEALLRFRHFLRHAYAVPLDPDRLRSNVGRLALAVAGTAPAIEAIVVALTAE